MRWGICIIAVLALLLFSACAQQTGPKYRGTDFDLVIYEPSEEFQDHIDMLQASNFIDVVEFIDESFAESPGIVVRFQTCGAVNAQWRPSSYEVAICYELLDYLDNNEAELNMEDAPEDFDKEAAVTFFYLHEVAHALIDVYDLPVTGREEDVADQFAVILLANHEADDALVASAMFFYDRMETVENFPIWSKHPLDEQRLYNLLCWAYGQNPDRYQDVVTNGHLPQSRADRCGQESAQAARSWGRLLVEFLNEEKAAEIRKKI
ncbi:hypothetical protein GOV07_03365 [Candidatus Woesearchaeota archaeon]|nr:hypothetical protein [Candidatus Woesearchaeota archaeon]